MQSTNHIAFKEWAAVCEALAEGRQIIIARKGGIHEGRAGFRVEHREFWLFPTYVHQQAAGLTDDGQPHLERALAQRLPQGTLRLGPYCVVEDVLELDDERTIAALAGRHVWSERTLDERFHYRRPGLFLLVVRAYGSPQPHDIPDSAHFAGCRSWVELPSDLSTAGLEPVLDELTFSRRRREIDSALDLPRPA